MKLTVAAFILWLVILVGLTFLFWLKPRSFFAAPEGSDLAPAAGENAPFMASLLAVLLFLSCFIFGLWIGIAELKGLI